MSERRRRVAPFALVAAADVMTCFIGILFVVLVQSKAKVETEVKELEARKAEVQAEIVEQETEREEALRLMEADLKKKEEEIKGQIAEQEAMLAQKQQNFQDWDWLVDRLRASQGMSRKPDVHLYLRSRGIYRDGSKNRMSDEQILAFLKAQAALAPTRSDGTALVAVWQENGANDQYIRLLDLEDKIPGLDEEVVLYTVILPSGVRAGPEQKGTEPIEKKKGGKR